jgi:ATP-dependent DNA helicase
MIVSEEIITSSGKFVLLDKMLAKLGQTNHKVNFIILLYQLIERVLQVLIFSTLVIFLDLLEAMCEHRNYGYTRLDGATSFGERIDAVCF